MVQWFVDEPGEDKHNADLAYFKGDFESAAELYAKVLAANNGKGVFQLATQTDDLARALIKAGRTSEALEWAKKLVRLPGYIIMLLSMKFIVQHINFTSLNLCGSGLFLVTKGQPKQCRCPGG